MNAQAAVALDRTTAFSTPFVTDLPELHSFELRRDPAQKALWITRKSQAPASVTIDQLRESRALDGFLMEHSEDSVSYKVLCSAQPGIFSLGGDLRFFCECIEHGSRTRLEQYAELAADAVWGNVSALEQRRIVSLAVVAGEAQGGGFEAALSCNTLVAERGSSFGFPEPLFGLFPGMGGELLLATRVDADVARRLVDSANRYSAEFLHDIGVVDHLVEPGAGEDFVRQLLDSTSVDKAHPESIRMAKRQTRLDEVRRVAIEESVARWVERALRLDARSIRNMKYILEMQARRGA